MRIEDGVDVREGFYNEVKKGHMGGRMIDYYYYSDESDKAKRKK